MEEPKNELKEVLEPDGAEETAAEVVEAKEIPAAEPPAAEEDTRPMTRYEEVQVEMRKLGVEPMKAETREIERVLSKADMDKLKDQGIYHRNEADRIEEEKKEITARMTQEMKRHEAADAMIRAKLKDGKETSDRLVMIGVDTKLNIKRVFDVETGEEVCQETLTEKDLQVDMGLGKIQPAPAAASKPQEAEKPLAKNEVAPGVIGIGYEPPKADKMGIEIGGEHMHSSVVNEVLEGLDSQEVKPEQEFLSEMTTMIQMYEPNGDKLIVTEQNGLVMWTGDHSLAETLGHSIQNESFVRLKIRSNVSNTSHEIVSAEASNYDPSGPDEEMPLPAGAEEGMIDE